MSGGIVYKMTGTLFLLLLICLRAFPQDNNYPVRIMFYNVENLFDIYDDSLTQDDEFLPSGLRRWNISRYRRKINSLCKTIIAAGEWEPPAVVALCEIENRGVIEDLAWRTNLSKFRYRVIHEDSPDERGIDVCLIYREDIAVVTGYEYLNPFGPGDEFLTRSVLYTRLLVSSDTIHLFVNHWPSRRGGVLAGEARRIRLAELVRERIDSVAGVQDDAKIIIMGDFNATPDDQVIRIVTGKTGTGPAIVNLSGTEPENSGTYRYRGIWETIDQVMVSDALLKGCKGLYTGHDMCRVFRPGFLLIKDPQYPGLTPFPTYSGYRYQGGYSDHLPVLLDLRSR